MQESAYKRMYQTATGLIEGHHTAHEDRILEGFFPTDLWDHRIPAVRLDMVLDNGYGLLDDGRPIHNLQHSCVHPDIFGL